MQKAICRPVPSSSLLTGLEGCGVGAHLLEHGHKTVAARGRQVLGQAYVVDKMQVGTKDFVGGMARQYVDEHRYDALHDYGVGGGLVFHLAVGRHFRRRATRGSGSPQSGGQGS